jgi:uncharacterized protein (TIGR02246 family)
MRLFLFLMAALSLIAADTTAEVRAQLTKQEEAWNRGDLATFMTAYKESPEITFVGKNVTRGFAAIVERYKTNYGSRDQMGALHFDEIEVKALGEKYALVFGRFNLKRNAEGGGDASGRFTLIAERTKNGWRFIHDHTS